MTSAATPDDPGVPGALRTWFVIHFLADVAFALPLMIAPTTLLQLAGWTEVDPVATRLVCAALFGIGIESLLGRHASREVFLGMLRLKLIWSAAACVGLAWSALTGAPVLTWALCAIFFAFNLLWLYWWVRLRRAA